MARKRSPGLEWQKKWIEAREYCKNKALEKSWGKALDIWLAIYKKTKKLYKSGDLLEDPPLSAVVLVALLRLQAPLVLPGRQGQTLAVPLQPALLPVQF